MYTCVIYRTYVGIIITYSLLTSSKAGGLKGYHQGCPGSKRFSGFVVDLFGWRWGGGGGGVGGKCGFWVVNVWGLRIWGFRV